MQALNKITQAMTSKKNGNQTFRLFERFDCEKDTCKCGSTFDKKYKLYMPGKDEPISYEDDMCWHCKKEQEDRKLAQECYTNMKRAQVQKIKDMFYNHSLINPKLYDVTFADYEPTNEVLARAKALAERYAANFTMDNPVNLMIIGTYGVGKSHLSVAITKELMAKDFSCVFISTPKLMSKIRSTYNKDSEFTEEEIIKSLSEVDCLVLDDIGAEATKQGDSNQHTWATSKLFEIIDNRIGKHTIFTSNYAPNELEQRLGGRNYSRMMEDTHVIKMTGDDYRLRQFKGDENA